MSELEEKFKHKRKSLIGRERLRYTQVKKRLKV